MSSTMTRTEEPRQISHGTGSRLRLLGAVGVAGPAAFGAVCVAMHYLQPELTPSDHFMSEYVLGDVGLLMNAAFMALAVGVAALALGLRRSLAPGRRVRLAVGLMGAGAVGFAASGVFNTDSTDAVLGGQDPSWHSMLHDVAGMIAFLGVIVGAFVLRGVFARDPRWRPLAPFALFFGLLLTGLLALMLASPSSSVGVAQRPFVALLLLWLGTLGCWLLGIPERSAPTPTGEDADLVPSPSPSATARSARPLAVAAVVGPVFYATVVVTMGILEPQLSLSSDWVSTYVTGDAGVLLNVAFVVLGISQIALALGLRRSLTPAKRVRFTTAALVFVGLTTIAGGLFPSRLWSDVEAGEPGWHQAVHEISGLIALPFVITVLFMLRGIFARDTRWRPVARAQLMYAVSFVVVLGIFLAAPVPTIGVAQRVFLTVVLTWLATTALWMLTAVTGQHHSVDDPTGTARSTHPSPT
jgi:hypothetical protein